MTRAQIRTLNRRILSLREELEDDMCRKYPTARMHVQSELNMALMYLEEK